MMISSGSSISSSEKAVLVVAMPVLATTVAVPVLAAEGLVSEEVIASVVSPAPPILSPSDSVGLRAL